MNDSHSRPETDSAPARWWLGLEWTFWFVAFPLIAFFNWIPISKFLFFTAPLLYAGAWVLRSQRTKRVTLSPAISVREPLQLRWILFRLFTITGAIALFAYLRHPDQFLMLPRERPQLWLMIVVLYPVLSALPQEFLYRRFYFCRYKLLFATPERMIWSNALVFAWLHLMYDNATAILLTFMGGWLFAETYRRTRQLWLPWLEHTAYGLAIFTFGLGRYFYEPVGG